MLLLSVYVWFRRRQTSGSGPLAPPTATFAAISDPAGVSMAQATVGFGSTAGDSSTSPPAVPPQQPSAPPPPPSAPPFPHSDNVHVVGGVYRDMSVVAENKQPRELQDQGDSIMSTIDNKCVVCLVNEPVMALLPCGHRCVCASCGPSLSTCPLCRQDVQEIKRIFVNA